MADETVPTPDGTPTPEPTTPAATPASEKTFTQADLDKIVKERLQREREKHADYDQLKAAADKLKAIEDAQLSETERTQKKLAEAEAARLAAENERDNTKYESAIIAEAAKLNFNDPNDAVLLVDRSQLKIVDGKVQGAPEAVKSLAESRKYLLKSSNPALATFNPAGGGDGVTETDAQRRARLYSGGGNFFDAGQAAQQGGGVVWPKPKPE